MSEHVDERPSLITHHAFVPDGDWWTTCKRCGLAEAAHAASMTLKQRDDELAGLPYRCPYCIDRRRASCEHGRAHGVGLDANPLGPIA